MWKLGLRPRKSLSGNICFDFSVLCLCSADNFNCKKDEAFLPLSAHSLPLSHCVHAQRPIGRNITEQKAQLKLGLNSVFAFVFCCLSMKLTQVFYLSPVFVSAVRTDVYKRVQIDIFWQNPECPLCFTTRRRMILAEEGRPAVNLSSIVTRFFSQCFVPCQRIRLRLSAV
jgi:hypothetical protein